MRRFIRAVKRSIWSRIERLLVTRQPIGRQIADRVERSQGRIPTPATDLTALRALLDALHPVTLDVPLVRIGPATDGGYLVPDDLDGIVACISPGVGDQSGFELDCAERGMAVFMADASVAGPAIDHPLFHFVRQHVDNRGETPSTTTVDRWVAAAIGDTAGDLLLQMDIEGGEWEVLPSISPELLLRCRIIVIELHDVHHLAQAAVFRHVEPTLRRILSTHVCVHIHPNNAGEMVVEHGVALPSIAEFTFLRRDRARVTGHAHTFPHPLDVDNIDRAPQVLPSSLYRRTDPA